MTNRWVVHHDTRYTYNIVLVLSILSFRMIAHRFGNNNMKSVVIYISWDKQSLTKFH